MPASQVTIKQIAKLLGISKSTVSRALQNRNDVNVETRRKVIELAEKLRYQPNSIALHLKNQRTQTIGVIIPETSNAFFSRAVGGIQRVANAAGYNVVICQSDESYPAEKKNLDSLISNHVDGLLISVSRETQNSDHFMTLLDRNIPVVFFDRVCESLETTQVVTDNYEVSFKATQHLIDQGCRKIAILAGPEYLSTSSKRVLGYRDALKQNNISFNPAWLLFPDFRCNSIEAFTNELLRQKDFPDAIFAINDMAAIEIMHVLKRSGLRIPNDVAVMGFNNEKVGEFMEPSLSSIDLPAQEMGETAAEMLIHHIKDPGCKPERRLIPSTLVVRSSTMRAPEMPDSKIA